jgi:APA family basic amino acid/polyamine antiporter
MVMKQMTQFKRTISWKVLSLYGLGNILGAGIYVLIGEVAGKAGNGLVWSFLLAGVVASFTAITYGALAGKYPVSAGAAVYTDRAFKAPRISTLIGLALAFSAFVSSSALLRGFNRYFQALLESLGLGTLPTPLVILTMVAILGWVALRGIQESTRLAVTLTLIEAGGLLAIILVAVLYGDIGGSVSTSISSIGSVEPLAIALGGFLAFYAFIGFEDMVNVAEEVKQPEKNVRKGMLVALIVASVLYILIAIAALAVVSIDTLATSKAPLSTVFEVATGSTFPIITIIGLFAVTNGVLTQIITSSRILYGLAREGWITKKLSVVSPKTKTPVNATLLALFFIALGALTLPLGVLASIASFGLLIIFTIVQLAALRLIIKGSIKLPIAIPIMGILTNMGVVIIQISSWVSII